MDYWIIKARPDSNDFSEFPKKGKSGWWWTKRPLPGWNRDDTLFL